jgi:ABC-type bacteriocin/lantibiotic exporter with double-glycine peptidase domain
LTISETGNSFLSLKQASQRLGVPGTIVRASVSDLQQFEMPLILLADSQLIDELDDIEMGESAPDFSQVGHYYLVTRASPKKIELIDGTTGDCQVLSTADINPNWIQAVFVPSRPFSTKWWLLIAFTISLTLLTAFVHWRYQSVNVRIE